MELKYILKVFIIAFIILSLILFIKSIEPLNSTTFIKKFNNNTQLID